MLRWRKERRGERGETGCKLIASLAQEPRKFVKDKWAMY
jgi:hypothetical protein